MISCDMVIAADHAKFGIPEAQRGLIAGAGGLTRLPKRVPLAVAYEMALTADPIDAQRAYELGLVNRVVPGDQVLDAAVAFAERIAKNAPLAVRTSKRVMHQVDRTHDAAPGSSTTRPSGHRPAPTPWRARSPSRKTRTQLAGQVDGPGRARDGSNSCNSPRASASFDSPCTCSPRRYGWADNSSCSGSAHRS